MKTTLNLKSNLVNDLFNQFILSNDEMICVRGGEGEPVNNPSNPPVRI